MNEKPSLGTVMIVDDAPGNLALLSDALDEAGYRVLVATDGYSALEQLNYVSPDVILMDGMMPGIDGFETCRRLKQNPATCAIPIIFMTALGELDDLLRGFGEGAVDYIVKPFRNEEVLARIGAHLQQARIVQRIEQALLNSKLAALAVDGQARVTWATTAAKQILGETAALPKPLQDWALAFIAAKGQAETSSISFNLSGGSISAKIFPCQSHLEYLLFLNKQAGDWDLQALQGGLGLTAREAEVLMWISRGKTNQDIGLILGNSPRTVNKHLEHIFEKLGVATRSAAVAVAMAHGGA
ncbi:MAG: response regulator [Candidatus Methylumidiphilus sp.]